jgi:hypothetical protein
MGDRALWRTVSETRRIPRGTRPSGGACARPRRLGDRPDAADPGRGGDGRDPCGCGGDAVTASRARGGRRRAPAAYALAGAYAKRFDADIAVLAVMLLLAAAFWLVARRRV